MFAEELARLVREYEIKNLDTLTSDRKTLIQGNAMGALSIMLLDEDTRKEMYRCEPYLDTLIGLAMDNEDEDPEAEMDIFRDNRQVCPHHLSTLSRNGRWHDGIVLCAGQLLRP